MQLTHPNQIGMFAKIAQAIGERGGDLGAVEVLQPDKKQMTRGLNIRARNMEHAEEIVAAVRNLDEVKVMDVADHVFRAHQGGKISIQSRMQIRSRDELSLAYTPGVARVSMAIAEDRAKAWQWTVKANSVAVVSDGSAVLGLGDIGPEAAMPVMEGKAMLFKEFGNIDAYPICLRTKDTDAIVETVSNLSVGFGGINLEDISAPRCFEVEEKLQQRLDIPVFHDDQHGTAVVTLAALLNALRLTRQKMASLKIVISGAGAAGVAITKMLRSSGAGDIVVCDREGTIHEKRADLNASKQWLARHTNPRKLRGGLADALKGAHVFIGVSGPRLVTARMLKRMAPRPIVFALANPTPEIMPEEAKDAFIVATGRSDYANQINNVLAFPGIFRGALNVRAGQITEAMKLAAAHAIARCVSPRELSRDFIIPSVFNRRIVPLVAEAVAKVAVRSAKRERLRAA